LDELPYVFVDHIEGPELELLADALEAGLGGAARRRS
jgi:hypothetical protein